MTILDTQMRGAAGPVPAVTAVLVVAWAAAAASLASDGALRAPPGAPPLPVLLAVALPLAAFGLLYAGWPGFRNWLLAMDLRLLVILQSWRVVGGSFLVLLSWGLLPGLFAWPAGLGDVAVGATAPLVALALIRRPDAASGAGFVAWNLLGILDFVVALGTGVYASGTVAAYAGAVTTAPMTSWPLGLIPGFLVPLFTMIHLAAILQSRHLARAAGDAARQA